MYHRARAGLFGNSPEMLDAHFAHVAQTYAHVLPGDSLDSTRLNVCLTFDDGYFDFYTTVFPLLKKHRLRAVLAVPASFLRETCSVAAADRLALTNDEAFLYPERGGFCTEPELAELVASGQVALAAHGMTHVRLDALDSNLGLEIETPQHLLQLRFKRPVESFVFPFGRFSESALDSAQLHYRYVFRIGSAMNRCWDDGLLYRVDADNMESPASLFAAGRRLRYRARAQWNRFRSR